MCLCVDVHMFGLIEEFENGQEDGVHEVYVFFCVGVVGWACFCVWMFTCSA
jgi:hypothetical protein